MNLEVECFIRGVVVRVELYDEVVLRCSCGVRSRCVVSFMMSCVHGHRD